MAVSSFDELILEARKKRDKDGNRRKVVVMCAADEEVLAAVAEAREMDVADAILVGDKNKIIEEAARSDIDLTGMEIIHETEVDKIGEICTGLVNLHKASVMMKGLVGTADYMKAVLNREKGLRAGKIISQVAVFELPTYHKLLLVTDAAINIKPDIEEKAGLVENGCEVLRLLGIDKPKVAAVCAVEKINAEKMPSTADADALSKRAKEGKLGNVYVDGPFGFDVAISRHSAIVKKLDHLDVPGDADLILADDIESGNMLYKCLNAFGQGKSAAIVSGAKAPLVLTSRSDTHEVKFLSIVLAIMAS
ncbi:MAG: phosphate butyryltransferase [Oligoflexia bacterium]|nr:phosphate butyryltransferase [Oligoflexia bacterium]